MKRVCSPRATKGLPHVAHLGRSSSGFWLPSSVPPICTTSWISCARNWLIRSSTAASISAHVACGCSLRHWVIPNTSRSPALTGLASADFVPVCSSWLSCSRLSLLLFFPVFYHLPPACKKMKRTRCLTLLEGIPEHVLYCSGILVRVQTAVKGGSDGSDTSDHPGWDTHLPAGRVSRAGGGGLLRLVCLAPDGLDLHLSW